MLGRIKALVTSISEFDPLTMAVGTAALVVLFVGAGLAPRIPWSLIVLVAGLAASAAFDLAARGVADCRICSGRRYPDSACRSSRPIGYRRGVRWCGVGRSSGWRRGLSAARLFAVKGGYRVETDQELLRLERRDLGVRLRRRLAVAGSLSKTAAVDRAGGKSQVAGLAAAAISLVVIMFLAPTLSGLPRGGSERDRRPRRLGPDRHSGDAPLPRISPDRPRCCLRGGRRGARQRSAPRSAAGGGDVDSRAGVPVQPGDRRRDGQGAGGEGRLGCVGEPLGEDHPAGRTDPAAE